MNTFFHHTRSHWARIIRTHQSEARAYRLTTMSTERTSVVWQRVWQRNCVSAALSPSIWSVRPDYCCYFYYDHRHHYWYIKSRSQIDQIESLEFLGDDVSDEPRTKSHWVWTFSIFNFDSIVNGHAPFFWRIKAGKWRWAGDVAEPQKRFWLALKFL